MKCSIQRGEAELNGTCHLSPHENICSIARMKIDSLFVLYNTKIDPCHLTLGTHLHLARYFNSIGIPFLNSPGSSPVKNFQIQSQTKCA